MRVQSVVWIVLCGSSLLEYSESSRQYTNHSALTISRDEDCESTAQANPGSAARKNPPPPLPPHTYLNLGSESTALGTQVSSSGMYSSTHGCATWCSARYRHLHTSLSLRSQRLQISKLLMGCVCSYQRVVHTL